MSDVTWPAEAVPEGSGVSDQLERIERDLTRRLEQIEAKAEAIQKQTARPTTDWYKRILDTVQVVVVVGGVIVALQQLIQVRKNSYQTAYDTISKEWLVLDRHFADKGKHLRPYLFGGQDIDASDPQYAEVDAAAHYVLNFLDYAIASADQLGPPKAGTYVDTDVWTQYIQKT